MLKKTERIIFKSKQKKLQGDLCGKELYPTESVKYLGLKIDKHENVKHENMLVLKYQEPSILPFLIPIYPTVVLFGLRIVALFNEL